MWCMCDAAATLKLDQGDIHILDRMRPKSRTGIVYGNFACLKVWSEGWWILNKLDDKAKLFVAWLYDWNVIVVVVICGQVMV